LLASSTIDDFTSSRIASGISKFVKEAEDDFSRWCGRCRLKSAETVFMYLSRNGIILQQTGQATNLLGFRSRTNYSLQEK